LHSTLLLPLRSTLFPYTTLFRSTSHIGRRINPNETRFVEPLVAAPVFYADHLQVGIDAALVIEELGQFTNSHAVPDGKLMVRCEDRKSTRLNSSHVSISYAVFCL